MVDPLTGRTILLPRAGDWADAAGAEVRRRGATAVIGELIRFTDPADPTPLVTALAGLRRGHYDWLILTSPRAVTAIAAAAVPAATRIATVGRSTARALAGLGKHAAFVPSGEQSARGLVAEWPDAAARRILLPRSSRAQPTIREGLGAFGITVDDPIAYRTVGAELAPDTLADLRAGRIDLVLLTSGSTVREFARQVGADAPVEIVTIGPVTTRDAVRAGLRVAYEAATPNVPAMLDAVANRRAPRSIGPGNNLTE